VIYQAFAAVKITRRSLCGTACHTHTVWLGVSIDGGRTFTRLHRLHNLIQSRLRAQFINVSVDRAGNVYVVYMRSESILQLLANIRTIWEGTVPSQHGILQHCNLSVEHCGNAVKWTWYGMAHPTMVSNILTTIRKCLMYVYFAQNLNALTPNSPSLKSQYQDNNITAALRSRCNVQWETETC